MEMNNIKIILNFAFVYFVQGSSIYSVDGVIRVM